MQIHVLARPVLALLAALAVGVLPAANPVAAASPPGETEPARGEPGVALVVWNRHIATFRVPFEDRDPSERAARAARRILTAPREADGWTVARREERIGEYSGYYFTVNGEFVFRLLEGDNDHEAGQTLEEAARAAEERLREVLDSRIRQGRWSVVARGLAFALLATIALAGALFLLARVKRLVHAGLGPHLARARRRIAVGGVDVWPVLGGLRQVIARILNWFVVGFFLYLWLGFVFHQFPYTEPWGHALGSFLRETLARFGWGFVTAMPGLFAVAVVFALAHAFNQGIGSYFRAVERGQVSVSWLGLESARATRQLLALLTWVFALVVAYPYIPGSETAAFKGVSVFLGLMVSLGSAGLVNQVMSGLAVIYSGAYQHDDFVRIGEQEGRVLNLGLLATRIEKPGGGEVSIPNAVVAATTTTNFSRLGAAKGEIVTTAVTIGYDAPWRQVHALLRLAAQRTPLLAPEPAPTVFQHALSDFYVEYQVFAYLARDAERTAALSRLHAEIQDAFNEHGVQIMSPHFLGQPEKAVVVPRAAWFKEPASAGESRVVEGRNSGGRTEPGARPAPEREAGA